jgi:hypothetical protein
VKLSEDRTAGCLTGFADEAVGSIPRIERSRSGPAEKSTTAFPAECRSVIHLRRIIRSSMASLHSILGVIASCLIGCGPFKRSSIKYATLTTVVNTTRFPLASFPFTL